MVLNGSCYCGEVVYELDDEAKGGILCHCKTCQKLNTQHSYNIQSEYAKLKVTKGATKTYNDDKADSGKRIVRHFCGTCGTSLFAVPEAFPGSVFIKVGALDQAHSIKPVAEIYVNTALPHSVLDKKVHGTAQYEGFMAKEVNV